MDGHAHSFFIKEVYTTEQFEKGVDYLRKIVIVIGILKNTLYFTLRWPSSLTFKHPRKRGLRLYVDTINIFKYNEYFSKNQKNETIEYRNCYPC